MLSLERKLCVYVKYPSVKETVTLSGFNFRNAPYATIGSFDQLQRSIGQYFWV